MDQNGSKITEPIYADINAKGYDTYLCDPQCILIDGNGQTIN